MYGVRFSSTIWRVYSVKRESSMLKRHARSKVYAIILRRPCCSLTESVISEHTRLTRSSLKSIAETVMFLLRMSPFSSEIAKANVYEPSFFNLRRISSGSSNFEYWALSLGTIAVLTISRTLCEWRPYFGGAQWAFLLHERTVKESFERFKSMT